MCSVCINGFWLRRQWCASGICDDTKPGVVNTKRIKRSSRKTTVTLRTGANGMKPGSMNGGSFSVEQEQRLWFYLRKHDLAMTRQRREVLR